jgi:conserved oligomeric Golgi complex subunit 8
MIFYPKRVFEIATQFNAIFRAQTSPSSQQVSVSLLSMWTSRRVHSFLSMLTVQMNRMEDSGAVRDAFDACVFFAVSLGRLGADFTAQLPPIFERKMHDLVVHYWKEGTNQLSETLRVCRDAGVASPLFSSSVDTTALSQAETSTGGGPLPPPRSLMAHPPLARFVNSFVTGLNELRRCLLPGIFSQLRNSCDELMKELRDMLQTNERAVMKPGLRGDAEQLRKVAAEMKQVLAATVDPYIRGALEYALGNEKGAAEFHQLLKEIKEKDVVEEETGQEVAGKVLEEQEGGGSGEEEGGSAQDLTHGAD